MTFILSPEYRRALLPYLQLLCKSEEFPIDIDEINIKLYTLKCNFQRTIVQNFQLNVDYKIIHSISRNGGRPRNIIRLSVPCFKEILMMQRTAEGKKARRYFILAEETLRRQILERTDIQDLLNSYAQYEEFINEVQLKEIKNEHYYQKILETKYANELLDKSCEHGEIDIHLSDKIIELKEWQKYKHALGQLLAYGQTYNKILEVAFFGEMPDSEQIAKIHDLFEKFDISVSYFDECDKIIYL